MDRGAWWTTVHEVAESDMTEDIRPLQGLLFARVFTGGPVKLRCLLKSAECLWVLPTEAGPRTGTRLLVLPWPSRPASVELRVGFKRRLYSRYLPFNWENFKRN